jgi:hypothetical protein
MSDLLVTAAPMVAGSVALAALVGAAVYVVRCVRDVQRTRLTLRAAGSLVEARSVVLADQTSRLATRSESIASHTQAQADAGAALTTNISTLRWVLALVPRRREELREMIKETVIDAASR